MRPDPYAFTFEPLFLVLVVVAGGAYAQGARRERPPVWRVALFALGLLLVAAPLNSPLETISTHYLLSIHLLQNVMIADWAPPLLVLGLTPGMRLAVARRLGRPWRRLTRLRVALPAWLLVWYVVHLSFLYDVALRNPWLLNVEHLLLLAAGTIFWWPVLARESSGVGTAPILAYLGIAFIASSFLGLALTFATTPIYSFYRDAPRLWGLSAAKDQNLGGILMTAEQTLVFLGAIVYFLLRLLAEEDESGRIERPAAR
ncbi:MAG: putative rane protein [Gaiellaceae bacterium]|nr:putative rane protein [Gaiellaceae bacterium]